MLRWMSALLMDIVGASLFDGNASAVLHMFISYPPSSDRLPVELRTDALFGVFDALVHWLAYIIACASVTVSLLVCMTIILLSFLCLFDLVVQGATEALGWLRKGQQSRQFSGHPRSI
jgi:hypothetical protein